MAKAKKTTASGELKGMKEREKSREKWRRISVMRKKTGSGKVTKIYRTVTKESENGTQVKQREECVTQPKMEKAIMFENELRFTRCIVSAFFISILLKLIGVMFNGPAVSEIKNCTWTPPERIDPYAYLFLVELQQNPVKEEFKTRPSLITSEANSESWKMRQPGTASEPSQLPFSHHIAAAHSNGLSEVDAALRSAPYQIGFSPIDWEIFTDFQILKKMGVFDVEKMRSLLLMPPLFNENNKKLGRDMMHHAEQAGVLPDEQSGSRKGKSSSKLVLEKTLSFDIIRQQKIAASHAGLDASQCYDRMAHAPTALSMIQHGGHEPRP